MDYALEAVIDQVDREVVELPHHLRDREHSDLLTGCRGSSRDPGDDLIDLAAALLGDDDLRSYSIEFWAKYSGAADYDQPFHRDYLNHTVLVPSADAPPSQVEMFVYLSDVAEDLGPIALLPRRHARDVPALPELVSGNQRATG